MKQLCINQINLWGRLLSLNWPWKNQKKKRNDQTGTDPHWLHQFSIFQRSKLRQGPVMLLALSYLDLLFIWKNFIGWNFEKVRIFFTFFCFCNFYHFRGPSANFNYEQSCSAWQADFKTPLTFFIWQIFRKIMSFLQKGDLNVISGKILYLQVQ